MKRLIKNIFKLILFVILIAAAVYTVKGYGMYKQALDKTSMRALVEDIRHQDHYMLIDQLPDTYKKAVIAVEDHRFYDHGAVDILAIGRAVVNNIKNWELIEGGSTITQQLAKNLYFTQERKLDRKIAEIFMARDFERLYGKDEILELYVNTIYFGSGYYCIYDASIGYFGVEPGHMSDYQSVMLAGIPNAPSVYSLDANPELASQRQKQVLDKMVKYKYLSRNEADAIFTNGR